jgi:RNA polymerase sigma-70 factor (ECF subfamily)
VTEPDADARFTRIYGRYRAQVYAYVVSRAGRQFADDVVSEAFLVAWRRLATVPADPLPWLLVVARNVLLDRYQDQVRQTSLASELRARVRDAEAGTDVAEGVAERMVVLAALDRLSEADRELLTLVAWHGLSNHAAARVVGCSLATFFVRLHRARRRLDQAMSGAEQAVPSRAMSGAEQAVPSRAMSGAEQAVPSRPSIIVIEEYSR